VAKRALAVSAQLQVMPVLPAPAGRAVPVAQAAWAGEAETAVQVAQA
jgi:hypothetical protein